MINQRNPLLRAASFGSITIASRGGITSRTGTSTDPFRPVPRHMHRDAESSRWRRTGLRSLLTRTRDWPARGKAPSTPRQEAREPSNGGREANCRCFLRRCASEFACSGGGARCYRSTSEPPNPSAARKLDGTTAREPPPDDVIPQASLWRAEESAAPARRRAK